MNISRFLRGDFFGIIIPGAFLLFNIILLFQNEINSLSAKIALITKENSSIVIIAFLFVLIYILGDSLRYIRPTILEKIGSYLTLVFHVILFLSYRLFKIIFLCFKKGYSRTLIERVLLYLLLSFNNFWRKYWKLEFHKNWETDFKVFCKDIRKKDLEPFPYINWFYDEYLKNSPKSFSDFYNRLKRTEYGDNINLMKGYSFINQVKILVHEFSGTLYDEILFQEGSVRFIAGICWSLILSILVILFNNKIEFYLFSYIYSIFLLFFIFQLHHNRVREVVTVLCSLAILKENKDDKFGQKPKRRNRFIRSSINRVY